MQPFIVNINSPQQSYVVFADNGGQAGGHIANQIISVRPLLPAEIEGMKEFVQGPAPAQGPVVAKRGPRKAREVSAEPPPAQPEA